MKKIQYFLKGEMRLKVGESRVKKFFMLKKVNNSVNFVRKWLFLVDGGVMRLKGDVNN